MVKAFVPFWGPNLKERLPKETKMHLLRFFLKGSLNLCRAENGLARLAIERVSRAAGR